jgi:hypothetical protein
VRRTLLHRQPVSHGALSCFDELGRKLGWHASAGNEAARVLHAPRGRAAGIACPGAAGSEGGTLGLSRPCLQPRPSAGPARRAPRPRLRRRREPRNRIQVHARLKSYDELAAELSGLAPDAIVVVGTPPALAAKRQTTTIPIILAPAADPVRTGLVASLSRPGCNVTGISLYGSEIARKRMEVFKEAVVGIRRIAVLNNAENPLHHSYGMTFSLLLLCSDCNFVCSSFQTSTSFQQCSLPSSRRASMP